MYASLVNRFGRSFRGTTYRRERPISDAILTLSLDKAACDFQRFTIQATKVVASLEIDVVAGSGLRFLAGTMTSQDLHDTASLSSASSTNSELLAFVQPLTWRLSRFRPLSSLRRC